MNVSIDEDLALPLAVGLLTDTGGFAHKNVLPSTFYYGRRTIFTSRSFRHI